jgi:hypothetical protein
MARVILAIGILAFTDLACAATALYRIGIQDVAKATTYTVETKFDASKTDAGRRKHFDTPGKDYSCTLAFFGMGNG